MCSKATPMTCKTNEREALLQFKQNLASTTLPSWSGPNCCNWTGVSCDEATGHVVRLVLQGLGDNLTGEISPSLQHLDRLQHLDLSYNSLHGALPPQLGNLSRLLSLSMSGNAGLRVEGGGWFSGLTSLEKLSMSSIRLHDASGLIHALNTLPSVSEINLSNSTSGFPVPPTLPRVNFTRLSALNLEFTALNARFPRWLFNVTALEFLSLRSTGISGDVPEPSGKLSNLRTLWLDQNQLTGPIPAALGLLTSLEDLWLSENRLTGTISWSLGNLTSCRYLFLFSNGLTGSIPPSLGKLFSLESLNLSENRLEGEVPRGMWNLTRLQMLHVQGNPIEGTVTDRHFVDLVNLNSLDLSSTSLELNFSVDWVPPFTKLYSLGMAYCNVGPMFPLWIQTQISTLQFLNLSSSHISGSLPDWLWESPLIYLDLSDNDLTGSFPPLLVTPLAFLNLANNRFQGPLPQFNDSGALRRLFISNNLISDNIPLSYCLLVSLRILDLSRNRLRGVVPVCLEMLESLWILNLAGNNIHGSAEGAFSSSCQLRGLFLNENSLSGAVPASLQNCKLLVILNLGQNNFTGEIPTWFADGTPLLKILIMSSNRFNGQIPQNLHLLNQLQIVDLSGNKLTGSIPSGFGRFNSMCAQHTRNETFYNEQMLRSYTNKLSPMYVLPAERLAIASMVIKGDVMEFSDLLVLITAMSLSGNELTGEIPKELGDLWGLKSLNLSGNRLVGKIPTSLGMLRQLESLDLSMNNLTGDIPRSMLNMTFLTVLNLSDNNLSGMIPSGSQFFTFMDASYLGNPMLCGEPLEAACGGTDQGNGIASDKGTDEGHFDWRSLYLGALLGFVCGFWSFCGALAWKTTWRRRYFEVIDGILGTGRQRKVAAIAR